MSRTEWGVKHRQGIATYSSEKEARENLPRHVRNFETSQRTKERPHLVRREVTDWTAVEGEKDK